MIKILLIEDEVKAVKSLLKGFKDYDLAVDFANDGFQGFQMAVSNDYDVIISDIVMPKMSGLQLVSALRGKNIKTPVLLLSALGTIEDKVQGLEMGADDYLVKPYEFRELVARIYALERRSKKDEPEKENLKFADIEMNLYLKTFKRNNILIELTPKEFALMEYFIRNEGRTISKKEIAEKVWDLHFDTNTNVVEVYINYVRSKVDKPFETKLIRTVFGVGYVLRGE